MISDDLNRAFMHGTLSSEDEKNLDEKNVAEIEQIRAHARVVAAYYDELVRNRVPENFAFPMTMALFSAHYARGGTSVQ